ncbi:molybdopterin-dependent oxidoreductase [Vulcanisaeta thermophila]|uniref:molybdopterin-dependent oxidoreductase n=1 Tax=Vulcanisaeta thermophila TaxID=867917 RepID=UPI000853D953|nr:molybdopterin-dependent oxidoreductase [Vulcanisaeta thermophila]
MVIACPRDCYDTCIFNEKYKPLNVFPINGFTCARGRADLRRNEVNRVREAYVDGKEVDLDTAIERVAKLIREELRRGPERVLHVDYDGNQGLLTWYYPARLFNAVGAASTDYSICSAEGHAAIRAHYGTSAGARPEDLLRYDSAVLWAFPASTSAIHIWHILVRRRMYRVSIDVRLSDTARRSERAIIVRPGTDVFLAIGVIKLLIENGWVEGRVRHFEDLASFVGRYDIGQLSEVSGVPVDDIKWLTEFYHERKPITLIGFALGRTLNGGDAIGLISLIPALLGLKRGFYYSNTYGWGIDFDYLRGLHMGKPSVVVPMARFGDYIEEGRVGLVYVWNSNPLLTLPHGGALRDAVEEGRVRLIVHDPFWSDTAKIADVVIPAPTFLEKYDVVYSYWHDYLVYNEPVRRPLGIPEYELIRRIAKAMGLDHPLLTEDPWHAVDVAIRGAGVTLEELVRRKFVKISPRYVNEDSEPDAHPLPNPTPPNRLGVDEAYLVFASHPLYTNTQFREVYGELRPVVYTHDYEGLVKLETEYSSITVRAVRDPGIPPGVILMYKNSLRDLGGRFVNDLMRPEMGRYGGTPRINGVRVRVRVIKTS